MIIPIFVWQSPKGRCYDNQLNLGDVRRHRQERPLLFALALDNGLADRKSAFKKLSGNNLATSCTNLVNFRPIISEFTLLKRAIFAAIRSQFTTIFLRHFGVPKQIGWSQFWFQRVISTHVCTSCRNLVRFGSVTAEFKTWEVVQSASKISSVTSGKFSRGRGCYTRRRSVCKCVSLVFPRGRLYGGTERAIR